MRRRAAHWRRAWSALRALHADPDDIDRALDVIDALDPDALRAGLERLERSEAGRQLLRNRPPLRDALSREALRSLPAGCFGRAVLEHLERWELELDGLVGINLRHSRAEGVDAWYVERSALLHDLWHVLSGYGADDFGETALLAFSWAQQGGVGRGFLTLSSVARAWPRVGRGWPRDAWTAWRRGSRAVDLDAVDYAALLGLPLSEARDRLGIDAPELAHPRGVPQSLTSARSRRAQRPAAVA